jgi:3-oxoacyl-[acyl-carrier-protein] synthase III
MRNAIIQSTGSYAPALTLPNSYFDTLLGENVSSWLESNLTIRERRWCGEDESTADLCVEAGRKALRNAGLDASALDLIIIGTGYPGTAPALWRGWRWPAGISDQEVTTPPSLSLARMP